MQNSAIDMYFKTPFFFLFLFFLSPNWITGREKKVPRGLENNITLPTSGEEAMKRLLACKGKDPYSILGVTQECSDDDIKKYYRRQVGFGCDC